MGRPDEPIPRANNFATTRWTVVLAAAESQAPGADAALATLCERYWHPLYWYVRRSGRNATESQDLVQSFFQFLLQRRVIAGADRRRGRFRSYLLGCLSNFLAHDHERAAALKRGGAYRFVPLEELSPHEADQLAAPEGWSPENAFDVRWAEAVVAHAVRCLRDEAAARDRAQWFEELAEFLTGKAGDSGGETESYRAIAARTGASETTVRTIVRRFRLRFREFVRAEVARTLEDPADLEAELRHLYEMMRFSRQHGAESFGDRSREIPPGRLGSTGGPTSPAPRDRAKSLPHGSFPR